MIIQLQAYSEPAGKYDPNAPLMGNEDNWFVDDDLSDNIPGRFQAGKDVALSDMGCLMVVADGMGGMNAGEVASQIAIDTVSEYFAPGKVKPEIASNPKERKEYLETLIKDADLRIKNDARVNSEHEGMGSTIIIAWIVGDKMTLSWCGDSRAYRWNPKFGIEPLSKDHSYVQELVNKGVITYNETFDHPQGNLVTRSLGDPNNPAKPETKDYDVYQNDIILLCSDGLSGVLRDKKTKNPNGGFYPGENIEEIIAANTDSLAKCSNELMRAAEQADWYDNVTVLLCQVKQGGMAVPANKKAQTNDGPGIAAVKADVGRKKLYMVVGSAVILIGIICVCLFFFLNGSKDNKQPSTDEGKTVIEEDANGVIAGQDITVDETSQKQKPIVKGDNGKTKENKGEDPKNDPSGTSILDNPGLKNIKKGIDAINEGNGETSEPEIDERGQELVKAKNNEDKTPNVSNDNGKTSGKQLETDEWRSKMLKEVNGLDVPEALNGWKEDLITNIENKSVGEASCNQKLKQFKSRIKAYNKLFDVVTFVPEELKNEYNNLYDSIVNGKFDPQWENRLDALKEECQNHSDNKGSKEKKGKGKK